MPAPRLHCSIDKHLGRMMARRPRKITKKKLTKKLNRANCFLRLVSFQLPKRDFHWKQNDFIRFSNLETSIHTKKSKFGQQQI